MEDHLLPRDEPGRPLPDVSPGFTDRVMARVRWHRRRRRIRKALPYGAAVVLVAAVTYPALRRLEPAPVTPPRGVLAQPIARPQAADPVAAKPAVVPAADAPRQHERRGAKPRPPDPRAVTVTATVQMYVVGKDAPLPPCRPGEKQDLCIAKDQTDIVRVKKRE